MKLSETEVTSIAFQRLTRRDAEIYCWHVFGKPTQPPLTYWQLKKQFKLGGSAIRMILRNAEDIISAAVTELRRVMVEVQAVEGYPEETKPLYFGITKQFGHNASTSDDHVQKKAVMGWSDREAA
jgi:hypothetical protein